MKRFTINLPDDIHARFKSVCALEGKEMTEVVRKFIEEYVAKAEKKKKT
jgi:metal-responsive CopG/Arc/MetJ family transcriptional regulator